MATDPKPMWRLAVFTLFAAIALGGSVLAAPATQPTDRKYGDWHSGNIGGGGFLQDLTICPSDPQRMYLTTDVGGLYRSDDVGRHWRMLEGNFPADAGAFSPRSLVVSPTDADRVTLAIGAGDSKVKGVFVSKNGGKNWDKTLDAKFDGNGDYRMCGPVLVANPAEPKTLYCAAVETGFYRSRDAGLTWQHFGPQPVQPTGLYVDRSSPKHLWMTAAHYVFGGVDTEPAIYDSTDDGEHWEKAVITPRPPRKLLQDPADPAALLGLFNVEQVQRSTDNGRTWTPFSKGIPAYVKEQEFAKDGSITAITAAGQDIVIGSCAGNFRRLNRATQAWDLIPRDGVDEQDWWGRMGPGRGQHFAQALGHLGADPKNPNHWWFTDWYALYQTYDAGRHWTLTIDGIEMLCFHCVTQDPQLPNVVHVGVADLGYFRSDDGGSTYAWNHDGIPGNIKDIRVCPAAPDRMVAIGPAAGDWLSNQVYLSRDHGRHWTKSPMTGLPPMAIGRNDMARARCNTVCVSPTDPDHLWLAVSGIPAANNGGVYESTDAGQTWAWRGQGLPTAKNFFHKDIWVSGPELAVSSDGSMVADSNDQRQVFRWDKPTAAWTPVELKASPNCVIADPASPGRFYLAGRDRGLLRSDDGGATWTWLLADDVSAVTVDVNDPKRLAAITPSNVAYSPDGGTTWAMVGDALPYRAARDVLGFAGARLVVGTGGSGAFWIDLSHTPATVSAHDSDRLPQAVALSDPNLLWTGRFDTNDPSAYRCDWSNSAVTLRFHGTDLSVLLESDNDNVHWQVMVDGVPTRVLRVVKPQTFRVADHLPDADHTVTLIQRTEPLFGTTTLRGLALNAGAKVLPAIAQAFKLEIIGDSITCGYGNEAAGPSDHFSSKTEDAALSYGALAGWAVNAQYVCVAWSGKLMWPKNTLPELYDRTLATAATPRWDFKQWQPDAVVINLGTNDIWSNHGKNPDEDGWVHGYEAFLDRVRANYPKAMIYCGVGPMITDATSPSKTALTAIRKYLHRIVDDRHAGGDSGVQFLEFDTQQPQDGVGSDWHPSLTTHQKMADTLVRQLRADFPRLVAGR